MPIEKSWLPTPVASLPVLTAHGARPGKTLVVTGAVHGDEYEGTRAILETFDALDTAEMAGTLIAVPACNVPAFWNGTRCSPLDGGNLARVFPGEAAGEPTSTIAYQLGTQIIAKADFYLDLHTGGVQWAMPSMAGYDASDPRSRAAALVFGAEVIWGHPEIAPGRTVSFAKAKGIPFLYTEAQGGGRIHAGDLEMMKRGIRNLMRHLDMISGPLEGGLPKLRLFGEGNISMGINAPARGFFVADVALLDRVRQGQSLGRLLDLHGSTTHRFVAPSDGVVALLRQFPTVQPNDPLFLIVQEE